ncbi:interleukin-8-like [Sceloporus undulatus]|uniref:interleukin-8-like n=1 Tax=Sceloporus undulatus TaxID=8520 RepID=UPI001C4DC264|nr:interleukin-8-like [Sceloporus undulatus]
MQSHRLIILWVLFLACHITVANIFDPTISLSCKCSRVTYRFIHPNKYARVEIFPAGITCKNMEIIITLKRGNNKVCIDPQSRWVKNLVKVMENTNEASS